MYTILGLYNIYNSEYILTSYPTWLYTHDLTYYITYVIKLTN